MRVCVGTTVHHPEDARITHRQIRALLDAGHEVTFVAPFTHCNVTPRPGIRAVDVPRAVGLRRGKALRAAASALRTAARDADLLLVHDIELLLALPRRRPPTVWDVHEDTIGALDAKTYLPGPVRSVLPPLIRAIESRAERRVHLILAEESYRARFPGAHPVVPDHTYVPPSPPPPPGDHRIVYVGHISLARGAAEMVEVARRLRPYGIRLDLIGPADAEVRPMLRDAQRAGLLDWFGYVPNNHALRMAEGALAGLSLLHDAPHRRPSTPTKVVEYMSRGVPVVTTPLQGAASLVGRVGCGTIVPFGEVGAVAGAVVRCVLRLREDAERRAAMGARGYVEALYHYHWPAVAGEFVALLERWAQAPDTVPALSPSRTVPA
ncbi:glycosyltransferase [Microbispora hainanensis]|uniref:Glycosyltransferase family 4 protein n=1 Tax=Microbispora hainanensis TaxID=568844 RepID=A0A544YM51_9ACTN|nr:glycosyltransferase [Microbispora hainanensis]TQS17840.1 glycosyltransferase family 4 protein [Microbispora hainanensis]